MSTGSPNLDAQLLKYTSKKEREILENFAGAYWVLSGSAGLRWAPGQAAAHCPTALPHPATESQLLLAGACISNAGCWPG